MSAIGLPCMLLDRCAFSTSFSSVMPVDVVCGLPSGQPCGASVTLGTKVGGEAWTRTTSPSGPGLTFDLTGPARRALGSGPSAAVDFYLHAEGPGGAKAMLGAPAPGRTLRLYVVRDLARLDLPTIPFGQVESGMTVLDLNDRPLADGKARFAAEYPKMLEALRGAGR